MSRGPELSPDTYAILEALGEIRDAIKELRPASEDFDDLKIYRVEGGPANKRLIGVWENGIRMFLASAGTHPIEPEPMSLVTAQAIRNEGPL